MSLFELYDNGGVFMYPILVCSIICVAVIIERCITYWSASKGLRKKQLKDAEGLVKQVKAALKEGGLAKALAICQEVGGPVASVVEAGLKKNGGGKEEMQEAMLFAANLQRMALEQRLNWLVMVANIAPLFGFLGTVWGLYIAFIAVSEKGLGNPAVIADGVSQALLTTVFGLTVAIPATIAHNLFVGKTEAFLNEIEHAANQLLEAVSIKTAEQAESAKRAS